MFEDLATLEALIWILTTVDDVMSNETRPISEGFSTFFAHKPVFLQCGSCYAKQKWSGG